MDSIEKLIATLGQKARKASKNLRAANTEEKNAALIHIASNIQKNKVSLITENAKDLAHGKANGLDDALLDRLMLDEERIAGIIESLKQIAALPDPVGEITDLKYRPSGIQVGKMRVPIGVMGIIKFTNGIACS